MASAPAASGSMGPPAITSSLSKKKTVPKGTSSYQAAWIVDDEKEKPEGDDDDESEDEMSVDRGLEARDGPEGLEGLDGKDEGEEEEEEEIELESRLGESERFEDLDNEEEEEQ